MSSIIKSFRVVDKEEPSNNKVINITKNKSMKPIIEAAKKDAQEIIKDAKTKAGNILDNAKEQAIEVLKTGEDKRDSFIHNAYEKSKDIFNEAKNNGFTLGYEEGHDSGYENGYNEGKLASDKLIKQALEIKGEYIKDREKLLKNSEKDIIELVTIIYEKLIDKKTKEDSEFIISLVLKGIEDLDLNNKLTIITSKEDYDIVQMSKDIILAGSNVISELEIKYDSKLEKGDCILETSKGSIDASLNNQLSEVKELLTSILNNE